MGMASSWRFKFGIFGALPFILAGCSLPVRPINVINSNTGLYNVEKDYSYRGISYTQSFIPEGYFPTNLTNQIPELQRGFVLISDLSGKLGVYSPIAASLIVPVKYERIVFIDSEANGTYLQAIKGDVFDLFDYRGYVVGRNISLSSTFSISAFLADMPLGEKALLEVFVLNGNSSVKKIEENRSRSAFFGPSYLLFEKGGFFFGTPTSLETIGLPGYLGSLSKEGVFTTSYQLSDVSRVSVSTAEVHSLFWKSYFAQKDSIGTANDFDYLTEGASGKEYHKLTTYHIALVTGNVTNYNVAYRIDSIRPLYNEEKQIHYVLAKVHPVLDKKLSDESRLYVINNEGVIVNDVTEDPAYLDSTSYLTPYKVIDRKNGVLLDEFFKPAVALPGPLAEVSYSLECFSSQIDGSYRLFDFLGHPVVEKSFQHLSIRQCTAGYGLGQDSDGNFWQIDVKGGKQGQILLAPEQTLTDEGLGYFHIDQGEDHGIYSYDGIKVTSHQGPIYARALCSTYADNVTLEVSLVDGGYLTVAYGQTPYQSAYRVTE